MHTSISIARSAHTPRTGPGWGVRAAATLAVACSLLGACHRAPPAAADASAQKPKAASAAKSTDAAPAGTPQSAPEGATEGAKEEAKEGVTLTPEQIEKLGLVTEPALAIEYSEHASGYGVVISHDTIAQAVAELATARATAQLSRSALKRTRQLSGTPGAMSADAEETAAQKAAVDEAALTLTTERLSSTLGMNPPWGNRDQDPALQDLARGKIKLLRATFPLGSLSGTPRSLRATRLGVIQPDLGWKPNVVWDAPADVNIPGRSYFALLKGADVGEGERLTVWAPVGESVSGVLISTAAAVMSEGKYWCYLQKKRGTFVRVEIDATKPTANGYFVSEGIKAGDQIVVTSVGQLLAKELGGGAEPD
jgi:hypothetical protein